MMGFGQSGISMGIVLASIIGGFLCDYGFLEGWGSIFIIFGSLFYMREDIFFSIPNLESISITDP